MYVRHGSIRLRVMQQLHPRQIRLIEEVQQAGSLSVEALAERFGVTLQTVRRDVRLLAEAGLLFRFHGGVRAPGSATENIAYRQRQRLNDAAKRRIAKAVAAAVPDGCSLIINIGTTTEAIAHELMQHRGLRVITNNLNVAAILSDHPDCELFVAGGAVRPRDRAIIGEAAVEFVRQFKVDIALIGISGIEADGSLRDFDYREVSVARAILEQSREVWLAADHSKFHRPAMVELARLDHRQAVEQLNRRTLRSPFNGVVVDQYQYPGALVEAGEGRKPGKRGGKAKAGGKSGGKSGIKIGF